MTFAKPSLLSEFQDDANANHRHKSQILQSLGTRTSRQIAQIPAPERGAAAWAEP